MDSQTISLVRTTFKAVAAVDDGPERLTSSFYSILFTDYPEARDFFPAAMETQRDRLVRALAYVVDRLEDPDNLLPFLAQLGRDHRKYGTTAEHYTAVGVSLLKALQNFAGHEIWTDDVDRAWNEALGVVASTMIGAADADENPAVWGGTVIEHRNVLRNLAVVRLQLNEPMDYRAGQYVSVQVPSRPRMWRYMSPANPPNKDGIIEFHIRGVTGGWVSPSMVSHTRIGEQWLLGAPLGALGIPANPARDLVMIGCGTGIAPLRAQVLELAEWTTSRRVHLFVGGHHPCDLYDLELLWELSLDNPWLTVTPVTENEDNPWWHVDDYSNAPAGMSTRLTGQIGKVVASLGSWEDRDIQIAGAPSMIQTTKFRLMAGGTPVQNIRHDPLY
ncbi:globin domain-containing protein [Antrihabitans sp. YC2-6]|uniref:globin domain-containing protein n=1 Tax=Antrihabitans sp. YC2-6 TaxID=2799498 RepID=UPI0018F61626|nr:globin domain-containing protein [Antrihabitans sp. YC2-6]MBJ8348750.1 flavoprotein [Antrihabitans sp. YC2-6]